MTRPLSRALAACLEVGEPAALVRVAAVRGSAPRDAGTMMLVTLEHAVGTIGGGRLEHDVLAAARALIRDGDRDRRLTVALGPAIGQCCGGRVGIAIARADAATLRDVIAAERREEEARPRILIFGAGPVGRATARALAFLPFQVTLIDAREDQLKIARRMGTAGVATDAPLRIVDAALPHTGYLVMTHSHALDSLIAAAILERGDAAYLGLIGSQTKRATFARAFETLGIAPDRIATMRCPIGGSTRDKRPAVIAALAAAELIGVMLGGGACQAEKAAGETDADPLKPEQVRVLRGSLAALPRTLS